MSAVVKVNILHVGVVGDGLLLVPRVGCAAERRSTGHRRGGRLRRSAASGRRRRRLCAGQPGTQVRPTPLPRHPATTLQVDFLKIRKTFF